MINGDLEKNTRCIVSFYIMYTKKKNNSLLDTYLYMWWIRENLHNYITPAVCIRFKQMVDKHVENVKPRAQQRIQRRNIESHTRLADDDGAFKTRVVKSNMMMIIIIIIIITSQRKWKNQNHQLQYYNIIHSSVRLE